MLLEVFFIVLKVNKYIYEYIFIKKKNTLGDLGQSAKLLNK